MYNIPGLYTAVHSHTPVQVSQDFLVPQHYPGYIPGWHTAVHSHISVQVSQDS